MFLFRSLTVPWHVFCHLTNSRVNAMRMRSIIAGDVHRKRPGNAEAFAMHDVRTYDPSHKHSARMQFVRTPPDAYVVILGAPETHVRIYVHFLEGFSMPCTGESCPHCRTEPRPYAYAACIMNPSPSPEGLRGTPAILPVPFTSFDLLEKDRHLRITKVGRKGNQKVGRLTWYDMGSVGEHRTPLPDVWSALHRVWSARLNKIPDPLEWETLVPNAFAKDCSTRPGND
jgi:hypothetical protein